MQNKLKSKLKSTIVRNNNVYFLYIYPLGINMNSMTLSNSHLPFHIQFPSRQSRSNETCLKGYVNKHTLVKTCMWRTNGIHFNIINKEIVTNNDHNKTNIDISYAAVLQMWQCAAHLPNNTTAYPPAKFLWNSDSLFTLYFPCDRQYNN